MYSLTNFVANQNEFFGDVFDKRPSKTAGFNPLMFVLENSMPLLKRVETLIIASVPSQVCWAVSKIPELIKNGEECKHLVLKIPQLLFSSSAKIEMNAVNAAYSILQFSSISYTPIFLQPILDRFKSAPALEYVNCLANMAETMRPSEVEKLLMPLVTDLFQLSPSHHHAACAIILSLPVSKMKITEDMFLEYLKSPIMVNFYICDMAEKLSSVFGLNWLHKILPLHLIGFLESFPQTRPGISEFLVRYIESIQLPSFYSKLLSIIEWGKTDELVAQRLIKYNHSIIDSHFCDLSTNLLPCIEYLYSSSSSDTRIKVVSLLIECDKLFLNCIPQSQVLITKISHDPDPKIRKTFVEASAEMFRIFQQIPKLQEHIIAQFYSLFNDTDKSVRQSLINSFMIIKCANSKPPSFIDSLLSLISCFVSKWRFYSLFLEIVAQLPSPTVEHSLQNLLKMTETAITYNPQALQRPAISFYLYIIRSNFASIRIKNLLHYFGASFAGSQNYHLRILFIRMMKAFMPDIEREVFLETIWPVLLVFYEETVSLVKAAILDFLHAFACYYDTSDPTLLMEMQRFISIYESESDPQVVSLLSEVIPLIHIPRAQSMQELSSVLPPLSLQHSIKKNTLNPRLNAVPRPSSRAISKQENITKIPSARPHRSSSTKNISVPQ